MTDYLFSQWFFVRINLVFHLNFITFDALSSICNISVYNRVKKMNVLSALSRCFYFLCRIDLVVSDSLFVSDSLVVSDRLS